MVPMLVQSRTSHALVSQLEKRTIFHLQVNAAIAGYPSSVTAQIIRTKEGRNGFSALLPASLSSGQFDCEAGASVLQQTGTGRKECLTSVSGKQGDRQFSWPETGECDRDDGTSALRLPVLPAGPYTAVLHQDAQLGTLLFSRPFAYKMCPLPCLQPVKDGISSNIAPMMMSLPERHARLYLR